MLFFQPHKIETDEIKLLKQSGMQAIEVGTDAASDATMRALHKGFTFDEVMDFNEKCVAQRVPCAHFVFSAVLTKQWKLCARVSQI